MKVSVGVYGRFHAFNLAAQLEKQGALDLLITSYPMSVVRRFNIDVERAKSLFLYEFLNRTNRQFISKLPGSLDYRREIRDLFAKSLGNCIPASSDIVTVWSGVAGPAFRRASRFGALKILERGSSHPKFTQAILEEEYNLQGIGGYINPEKYNDQSEYEEADYIVIPSSFVKRTFIDAGFDSNRLIVEPYGVDLVEFPFKPIAHKPFRFIYVGAMSFRKGVHYLLKAFSELKLKDAELWLVGGMHDEMKPVFKKYEGSYRYIGPKNQSDLWKFYNQCDAFCICSVEEGMAMVQMQAMACGLPIICTTNTGGEDLCVEGESGYVLPIRDVEALKERMLEVYKNRAFCRDMGLVAKHEIQSRYKWENYGKRIFSAYAEAMNKKQKIDQ
jgi:glycosyltransferase involved in cell wall biosynthesis